MKNNVVTFSITSLEHKHLGCWVTKGEKVLKNCVCIAIIHEHTIIDVYEIDRTKEKLCVSEYFYKGNKIQERCDFTAGAFHSKKYRYLVGTKEPPRTSPRAVNPVRYLTLDEENKVLI